MSEYKALQEAFVSNLHGSSILDISFFMLIAPLTTLFQRSVSGYLNLQKRDARGIGLAAFLVDFFTVVFPMVLTFLLSDYRLWIYASLLLLSLAALLLAPSHCLAQSLPDGFARHKPFLTNFRTSMMLSTCIAILAVDFPLFPRAFAKTEAYGLSVMDVGVGGFVFSLGLVSQKARISTSPSPFTLRTWLSQIKHTTQVMAPSILLGTGRYLLIVLTNYHNHVSEYGVHWNFFFTLAFVSLFGVIIDLPVAYTGTFGLILLAIYQILLSFFSLESYMMDPFRGDFLSQNKEGVFSLFGYTALYLLSSHLGHIIMTTAPTVRGARQLFAKIVVLCLACYLLGPCLSEHVLGLRPSRKMANLCYVVDCLVVMLQPLALLLLLDILVIPQNHLLIDTVSNRRHSQLMVFLLANVFTGLINVAVPTLFVSDAMSSLIILAYIFAVCAVPYVIRTSPKTSALLFQLS